jgi:hypothetical protein
MKEQATMLVRSGILPEAIKTPETAVAIMLKARELGIGPMEAFEGIHVIKGRPTVSPQLQLTLIYRSGLLQDMKVQPGPGRCTVTMVRRGGMSIVKTFSVDDAKRAGLAGKDVWKSYPEQMCQWRAVGYCADILFPDVTGGMYRPEEMGAVVDADGEPVPHDENGVVLPAHQEIAAVPVARHQQDPTDKCDTKSPRFLRLMAMLREGGYSAKEDILAYTSSTLHREIFSRADLTVADVDRCLDKLQAEALAQRQEEHVPPHQAEGGSEWAPAWVSGDAPQQDVAAAEPDPLEIPY